MTNVNNLIISNANDIGSNTRLVVNITSASTPPSTGILEKSDYLPFGTRVATSSTPLNRWRQSGKEEQVIGGNDLGVLDFGARHYDPWLARWTTQDPMAGKYTNLSPYSYCAGNPTNMVDPNGSIIIAKNQNAKNIIRQSIPKADRAYVRFDNNGVLDNSLLTKNINSTSNNFYSLVELSESDINYYVSVQEHYSSKGQKVRFSNKSSNGVYGVTLFPDAEVDTSPDSDVHIITSSLLNPKEQVLNYLHEAYGHAVLYDRKQHGQNVNPNHIYVVKVIGEEYVEELGTYI